MWSCAHRRSSRMWSSAHPCVVQRPPLCGPAPTKKPGNPCRALLPSPLKVLKGVKRKNARAREPTIWVRRTRRKALRLRRATKENPRLPNNLLSPFRDRRGSAALHDGRICTDSSPRTVGDRWRRELCRGGRLGLAVYSHVFRNRGGRPRGREYPCRYREYSHYCLEYKSME